MQNFTSFVNDQHNWEEVSPHRHDCHDPPHAVRVGFLDDQSPPRKLAGVARSGPWRTTPAQVGFPRDATRRRRPPWVVASDGWTTGRGMDYLRRNRRGEDSHPEEESRELAGVRATCGRVTAKSAASLRLLPGSG
jgi:hypothetical protein